MRYYGLLAMPHLPDDERDLLLQAKSALSQPLPAVQKVPTQAHRGARQRPSLVGTTRSAALEREQLASSRVPGPVSALLAATDSDRDDHDHEPDDRHLSLAKISLGKCPGLVPQRPKSVRIRSGHRPSQD
jgi:hypothetical protein